MEKGKGVPEQKNKTIFDFDMQIENLTCKLPGGITRIETTRLKLQEPV